MLPFLLFLLALVVRIAVARGQHWPGYMDATYYYEIARSLAEGRGFSESFLWNYLGAPEALPHPSNAHWLPFTSMVAAPFLAIFGGGYRAAQIPFVFLSAAVVPVAYGLTLRLFGRRDWAVLSAMLALGGGTCFPVWTAIDSYALYALIGTAVLWLGAATDTAAPGRRTLLAFLSGAAVGLGHLTRADGPLLFVPLLVLFAREPRRIVPAGVGYLAVMGPWLLRNAAVFGAPLPGGHLVWLRDYQDLFAYDPAVVMEPWSAADWATRLVRSFGALARNGLALALVLQVVFFPCAIVGLWAERGRPIVRAGAAYLAVLLVVMSFVFTEPGPRGSFGHSVCAVLLLLFALAPVGLARIVAWVAARRPAWNASRAERFFAVALFAVGQVVTETSYTINMTGESSWNRWYSAYPEIEAFLDERGSDTGAVFCINPPAYHYWSGRPALVIPTDGEAALRRAAARFGGRYLVVERDHPRHLDALYERPGEAAGYERLGTWTDSAGDRVELFRIVQCP